MILSLIKILYDIWQMNILRNYFNILQKLLAKRTMIKFQDVPQKFSSSGFPNKLFQFPRQIMLMGSTVKLNDPFSKSAIKVFKNRSEGIKFQNAIVDEFCGKDITCYSSEYIYEDSFAQIKITLQVHEFETLFNYYLYIS